MIGGETIAERIAAEYTKQFSRRGAVAPKIAAPKKQAPQSRRPSLAELASADLAKRGNQQVGGNQKHGNQWVQHALLHHKMNPGMSYKKALQTAGTSYYQKNK